MIKIYGGDKQFSSWSMRAIILLEESGVEFDYKMIGLDWPVKYLDNNKIEIITQESGYDLPEEPASGCGCQLTQLLKEDDTGLIKSSFTNYLPRVPVFIDTENGVVISDILAMERYLYEQYNINLLHKNIKRKYEILTYCSHIHADLLPLMSGMSFSNSFRNIDKSEISEEAFIQLNEEIDLLDNILNTYNSDYLFSENISFADIMFSPLAQAIRGWNIEIKSKNLDSYLTRILNHSSIKKYLTEANIFYDNINNSKVNSPKWIVSHYRYHEGLKMLNNPKYDIYHILDNVIAEKIYHLSKENKSTDDIVSILTKEYDADSEEIKRDVMDFFDLIHPNKMYTTALSNE